MVIINVWLIWWKELDINVELSWCQFYIQMHFTIYWYQKKIEKKMQTFEDNKSWYARSCRIEYWGDWIGD